MALRRLIGDEQAGIGVEHLVIDASEAGSVCQLVHADLDEWLLTRDGLLMHSQVLLRRSRLLLMNSQDLLARRRVVRS